MLSIITIIHVLAAVSIVALVLLQHGKGADAGAAFGAGSAGSIFGARGPASFLTRATAALAVIFFLTSLSLAYLSGQTVERRSITERVLPVEQQSGPSDVPNARETPQGAASGTGTSDVPVIPSDESAPAPSGEGQPAGTN